MGPDWVYGAKFLLDTTKSTHLLHKLLTLLSNQGWPKDAPKNRNFHFLVRSYQENVERRQRSGQKRLLRLLLVKVFYTRS